MFNKILDYEQVIEKAQNLCVPFGKLQQCSPIGYTTFNFPILHYTYGNGKYHIVISGATHGAEIISTDLVLTLMVQLPRFINPKVFTIHFIPMLNPEGYLICTSAIRKLIPRTASNQYAQPIIKKYIQLYHSRTLEYQKMFANIDFSCISTSYKLLRENIKRLYNEYSIPAGTLQVWSSNGNGIDLNQNCPYNNKINSMQSHTPVFGKGAYSNICATTPGPIGCPCSSKVFKFEPETKCFRNLLLSLRSKYKLCAYFNYHSAEDTIFYKPILPSFTKTKYHLSSSYVRYIEKLTEYNKKIALLYSSKTSHHLFEGVSTFYCFNDMLRLEVPGDILIELSPCEGNPLSAYADNVYGKTIEQNVFAITHTITHLPKLYDLNF